MAHAVEHCDAGAAGVDRVVDGVAGDLVGRFQGGGDGDRVAGEGQRREQGPLHLGGQAHLAGAAQPDDGVAVHGLGHDQFGGQRGEAAQPGQQLGVGEGLRVGDDRQHAEPLAAVEQGQPDPLLAVGQVLGEGLHVLVGATGDGAVDRQRAGPLVDAGAVRPEERHQDLLLQVGQVDQGAVHAEPAAVQGQQPGKLVLGEQVRGSQQLADDLLAGAARLGDVHGQRRGLVGGHRRHATGPGRLGAGARAVRIAASVSTAEVVREFPPDARAVGPARRFLRQALQDQLGDDPGSDLADLLLMVANELATNAVLHARTEFTVRLVVAPDLVRVEVADDNSRSWPCLAPADATSGRGWAIVDGSGLDGASTDTAAAKPSGSRPCAPR